MARTEPGKRRGKNTKEEKHQKEIKKVSKSFKRDKSREQ